MPKQVRTRAQAIEDVTRVLRAHGFEGASLSRIQAATGLKSSSLYNYFPGGKDDMADAALDHAAAMVGEGVAAALAHDGPAEERLRLLFDALTRLYEGGRGTCLLNLFAIGDVGERFGERLRGSATRLIDTVATIIAENGVWPDDARRRAEDALIAIEGALVVSRALGRTEPFERTMRELPGRLLR